MLRQDFNRKTDLVTKDQLMCTSRVQTLEATEKKTSANNRNVDHHLSECKGTMDKLL